MGHTKDFKRVSAFQLSLLQRMKHSYLKVMRWTCHIYSSNIVRCESYEAALEQENKELHWYDIQHYSELILVLNLA